jgi:hypothetical protein
MAARRKASRQRSVAPHVANVAPAGNPSCSAQAQRAVPECGGGSEIAVVGAIEGQLLTLGDQHRIAIHSRDGELWVAEFHGERVELVRAAAWFRLHFGIGRTSFSLRRALRSAAPVSSELAAAIDKLHRRERESAWWFRWFRSVSFSRRMQAARGTRSLSR